MALALNQELVGTVGVGSGNRVITFSNVVIPANASLICGVNFNAGGSAQTPAITISGGPFPGTLEASVGNIAGVAGMMCRIWSAFETAGQTATITLTGSGHASTSGDMEATLWIFTGGRSSDVCGAVDTYQSSTADPTNTAGLLQITTTVSGAVLCMSGIDWEATTAVTPSITNSGTTVVNQNHRVTGQSTHYNFRSAIAGVATVGTVCRGVIDVSGNGTWDCCAVEVLPAAGTTVSTGVGALTLTGFAPTVSVTNNTTVSTGLGQLTLTGFSPQVNLKINTDVGSLVLTGFAPQVNQKINTDVGQLTVTGFAPSISVSNNVTVSTGTGVLTLTGFTPQVNQKINTNTGQLTINGFAPTILTPVVVNTGTGQLTLTGFAPNVGGGTTASTQTGVLTLTGFAPSIQVSNNQTASPGTGVLTITGFSPSVQISDHKVVVTDTGQLVLTGFEPMVLTPITVLTGTGQLILTGFRPSIVVVLPETIILPAFFESEPILQTEFEGDIILPVLIETDIIFDADLR